MNFNPDDPKWTAYILGELDAEERAAERAAIEELLESSEEARTYLDELRVAAGALEFELKAEFKSESTPGLPPQMNALNAGVAESLTTAQREAIESAATSSVGNVGNIRWFKSPQSTIAALAVAALILIAVAMPSLWRSPRNEDSSHSVIAENAKVPAAIEPKSTPQAVQTSPVTKPSGLVVTAVAGDANTSAEKSVQSAVAENSVEEPAVPPAPAAPSGAVATGIATVDPGQLGQLRIVPEQATVTAPAAPAVAAARGGATAGSSISGNVTDSSNALIPGVEVTATNTDTGVVATTLTNDAGTYRFSGLPPGPYKISASLVGFQTATIANINLGSAEAQRFNLAMTLGNSARPEVVINAQTMLVTSSATIGQALSEEKVRSLPLVGNNVLDLIATLQGQKVTFKILVKQLLPVFRRRTSQPYATDSASVASTADVRRTE